MSRPKHFFFVLLTGLLSLVAFLVASEITIRLFVPPSDWQFRDATRDWVLDKRLGWIQKPNLDVTTRTEQGWTVRFQTNEDGLTPPTARRKRREGTLRIMFFGDSTVVGRDLPQDKTVNVQLENFLRGKKITAEVVNAGVQGYSTDQVFLRMQQLLPRYRPDVVIYGACDNDFAGNSLRVAYGLAKPVFRVKTNGDLEEIPPELVSKINFFGNGPAKWLQFSALYRLIQPTLFVIRARMGSWEERNLLGIAPEIYFRPDALSQIDWQIFSALIREMKKTAEKNGALFFFYTHPAIAEVWDPYIQDTEKKLKLKQGEYDRYAIERRLKKVDNETGASFIPLIDYFRERQFQGPFHLLPRDPHSNPVGNRLTAEVLGQSLVDHLQKSAPQ